MTIFFTLEISEAKLQLNCVGPRSATLKPVFDPDLNVIKERLDCNYSKSFWYFYKSNRHTVLQTCTALIKKNGAVASLQKVEIRDTISLTEDETSDPFVFLCEWALTSRTIHLGRYCASTANRTVEGLKVLWVILQGRPSLECWGSGIHRNVQRSGWNI